MGEILREHALNTLWCEPRQDRQYVIKPARLTRVGGAVGTAVVLWELVNLPTANTAYHVYQIGQLHPSLFDVQMLSEQWHRIDTLCNALNLVVDIFLSNGARVHRSLGWLRLNRDGNLILGIAYRPRFDLGSATLDNSGLTLRFYSNSRFDDASWRNQAIDPLSGIRVHEQLITNQQDFTDFLGGVAAIQLHFGIHGRGLFQRDGFIEPLPQGWTTAYVGKYFSYSWDETVKAIDIFPLSTLPVFESLLDAGQDKYAVVRQPPYTMIDYHDDLDIYVVSDSVNYRGVYLGRVRGDEVRQLTHTAYAVRKGSVDSLIASNAFLNTATVALMVVVREGGRVRGLMPNHHRVEVLYQLTHSQIVEAMTGEQTQVPEWKAATLEQSAYTAVMRTYREDLTDALVEEAYGYNTATLVACAPLQAVQVSGTHRFVSMPPLLMTQDKVSSNGLRSLYGYVNGTMVGWVNDAGMYDPVPLPSAWGAATHVECFNYQTSTTTAGFIYDQDVESTDLAQYGFRAYACPFIGGVPSEYWEDITDTAYYTYDPVGDAGNGFTPRLVWNTYLIDFANLYPAVKINKTMHVAVFNGFSPVSYTGVLDLTVTSVETWLGISTTRPQSIEPGCIDVFVNGQSLIEDVDYYVEWPRIVIVKRLTQLDISGVEPRQVHIPVNELEIVVRSYGYAQSTTVQHYKARETGFAKGGILSVNNRYNVRNDRNIRVVYANQLLPRPDVRFAEESTGPLHADGRPYAISDYVLAVENFTTQTTTPYKDEAFALDERVIDYVTTRLPEATVAHPHIAIERWEVVSPFLSRVIHALLAGDISSGSITPLPDPATIATLVAPYLAYLDFDPCLRPTDFAYVVVYAHPYTETVEVTAAQYRFVEYLVAHYLLNHVDPTPSMTIG